MACLRSTNNLWRYKMKADSNALEQSANKAIDDWQQAKENGDADAMEKFWLAIRLIARLEAVKEARLGF